MAREIDLYIEAIGVNSNEDYILRPREHADQLPANAGALARVLRHEELQPILDQYVENDKQAGIEQKKYKFWARTAIWSVFWAVVAGSLATSFPLSQMLDNVNADFYARLGVITIILLALFTSFSIMFWMEWVRPFEKWNEARGKAEFGRKELFRAVFASPGVGTPLEGELKLLPLKLEYFRRYLLDDQMIYYKKRGKDHERSEKLTRILWTIASVLVLVLLIATFLIGVISPMGEQGAALNMLPGFTGFLQHLEVDYLDSYILAGGIIFSALFAAKLAMSLLDGAKGNAVRFRFTHDNLQGLRDEGLEAARANALAGNEFAVDAFVNNVMSQISAEHQDWVKLFANVPEPGVENTAAAE